MGILFLVLATCFCLAIRATAKENHASFVNDSNSVVSPTSAKTKSSKPHSPRPPRAKSPKGGGGVESSSSPSNFPSLKPSNDPSASPSGSSKPSSQPSLSPSQSAQPSSQPSLNPSSSGQPSLDPSASPSESREPSSQPSLTPSQSAQPSSRLCGPQTASYDESLGAPKCSIGSLCDSGTTLNGRGTILNGNEPNYPNTLNSCCVDGNSGTYHDEESIDRIVVTRASGGERSDFDCELTEGDPVTITATVWCWEEGISQYNDFYYASDALNPVWIKIGDRKPCQGGGLQNMTASYSLPQGSIQAVRANLMYGRADPGIYSCTRGGFDDTDDLVITVVQSESAQPSSGPSSVPSGQPSSMPSEVPSTSGEPSSQPSLSPSESAQPSSEPSFVPSGQPSSMPSDSPSTSGELSSRPSLTPSQSAQPSSGQSFVPSGQPSLGPSIEPSLSSLPTSALSRYVLVGQGECQGSEPNSRYGKITISSDSADENVCAALCNECVFGQFPGGEFRGFQLGGICICLVDFSAISNYNSAECSSLSSTEVNAPVANGPITGSNGQSGYVCYKIKVD